MLNWCRVNNLLIGLLFFLYASAQAQHVTDNDLMIDKQIVNTSFETKRSVTYLFANKNALVKYNPISLVFGGLLYVYQKTISVQIGAACPYEVNCSNFSKQCIQKYGILKGIPLTADRLTRCTKLAAIDMIEGVDFNSRTHKIYDHPNDYSFKIR